MAWAFSKIPEELIGSLPANFRAGNRPAQIHLTNRRRSDVISTQFVRRQVKTLAGKALTILLQRIEESRYPPLRCFAMIIFFNLAERSGPVPAVPPG
jgi:hypothetical protein